MPLRLLLLLIARKLKTQSATYRIVLKDSRTPGLAKILLGLAVFYLMLPIDIIPDFIPFVGQLDDAIVLPALIGVAFVLVPKVVWQDARKSLTGDSSKRLAK